MNFRNSYFGAGFACLYFFLGSTSSLAGNTWTEVMRKKFNMPYKNMGGYVNYIDVDSIRKRGNIVYFSWGIRLLDENGFEQGKEKDPRINSGKINCKDKTAYLTRGDGIWVSLSEIENKFWMRSYPIVCKGNKFKLKFWE